MRSSTVVVVTLLVVAGIGFSVAAETTPPGVIAQNGIYTDARGHGLYIWDDDRRPDVSSCYGNCGHNWPAFEAPDDAQDVGAWKIIFREDGTRQWSYKGKPVYTFILDMSAGDRKGDGVANRWHAARP